jgi:hypothetical protein
VFWVALVSALPQQNFSMTMTRGPRRGVIGAAKGRKALAANAPGWSGRGGLFFIAGCVSFVATTAFFALLALGGAQALEKIRQLFGIG